MTGIPRLPPAAARAGVVVSALGTTVATFGPFARSGERVRSSYELVDVAGRAGVLAAPFDRFAPVWFLVPALCGVVLLALSTQRDRLGGVSAITLGALVGAAGALVQRSVLGIEPAGVAAMPLGVLTMICGTAVLVTDGRRGGAT